ncbi:hypothetical protein CMI37_18870 [Candidatus Pacearchaeota archaeon]|nr:hypothetical protein [Candidatus Pacearchaeota archaeon]
MPQLVPDDPVLSSLGGVKQLGRESDVAGVPGGVLVVDEGDPESAPGAEVSVGPDVPAQGEGAPQHVLGLPLPEVSQLSQGHADS